jgi:hypothetical protein
VKWAAPSLALEPARFPAQIGAFRINAALSFFLAGAGGRGKPHGFFPQMAQITQIWVPPLDGAGLSAAGRRTCGALGFWIDLELQ